MLISVASVVIHRNVTAKFPVVDISGESVIAVRGNNEFRSKRQNSVEKERHLSGRSCNLSFFVSAAF